MNKQQALREKNILLDKQAAMFCPLIKQNCVMTCICLVKVVKSKPDPLYPPNKIYSPEVYCNNPTLIIKKERK